MDIGRQMRRYIDERLSRERYQAGSLYEEEEERPVDAHEVIHKFLRRKKLFLYVAIPIFVIASIVLITKSYKPIYRATFDIGVAKEKPVEGYFSGYSDYLEPIQQIGAVTQRVISSLLSVNLAEKVIDRLGLYTHIEGGKSEIEVDLIMGKELAEPYGPLALRIYEGSVSMYNDGEKISDTIFGQCTISKDGTKIKDGILNEYLAFDAFKLRIRALSRDVFNKTYELMIYPRRKMALALRNSLSMKVLEADKIEQEFGSSGVPFSGEGGSDGLVSAKSIFPGMNLIGVLRISVNWSSPHDALLIANALSEEIMIEDRLGKSQPFKQSMMFLDSQLVFYQSNLTELEENIRRFKEQRNISDLKASTQALITQVSELESIKNQLEIEQNILTDLNVYLAKPSAVADTLPNFAVTLLSDAVLREFYSELLQAEAALRGRLREYSNNHPKVMEIRARLGGLKEQLKEEVGKRMSSVKTEIASYNTQIRMLQGKLDNVPLEEVSLARLERDRETAEKLYRFFAEKLEETRVQEAGVTSDLKIINPALVSDVPVNARGRLRGIFMAFIMAVIAGSLSVFVVDYLDTTVKDPDKLRKVMGAPILETIPMVEDKKEKPKYIYPLVKSYFHDLLNGYVFRRTRPDHTVTLLKADFNSPDFEAFRKLALNLDFVHPYKTFRVLYVTSPGPGAGKTFVTLNLGYALGNMGKKIIMLDTDFRKKAGHLTDVTKYKKELGLFDVLKGSVEVQDVTLPLNANQTTHKKQVQNKIDLLPLGKVPPNPFVYLESKTMSDFINGLKEIYDCILVDGVPLLLFADASFLANFADGVIVTARYGNTGIKDLRYARDVLASAKSNVLGVIMNGVPKSRGSYYYHRAYKYYTKYYNEDR